MYGLGCASSTIWSVKRSLHDSCEINLCPSASTRDSLRQQGFREEKIRVWSRGVDCSTFNPAKKDDKLRSRWLEGSRRTSTESFDEGISMRLPTSDRVVLLYVGRLAWEKNLRVLVEAYRGLDHAACHLVIVGDGPARPSLEDALRGFPVTFTGYRTGEDLASCYASADVFVFPSVSETFGQVVTEAHASGLPVVAIKSDGLKDIILPGLSGILVDRNDEDQEPTYREAIERLILDPTLRQKMSKRARERAADFTWEGAMEHCIHAYQEVYTRMLI